MPKYKGTAVKVTTRLVDIEVEAENGDEAHKAMRKCGQLLIQEDGEDVRIEEHTVSVENLEEIRTKEPRLYDVLLDRIIHVSVVVPVSAFDTEEAGEKALEEVSSRDFKDSPQKVLNTHVQMVQPVKGEE